MPHNSPYPRPVRPLPEQERARRLLRCYEIIDRAYRAEVAKAEAVLFGQTKDDATRVDDESKA